MAIEATPIEPQEVTYSPKHQNLADQIEQGVTGLWKWFEQYLPEHATHKPNALNNLKQAYDNAIAAVKADAEATAQKLADEGKAALETGIQGAESAAQDALTGVAQAAGNPAQSDNQAASDPSVSPSSSSGTTSGESTPTPDASAPSNTGS